MFQRVISQKNLMVDRDFRDRGIYIRGNGMKIIYANIIV